MKKRLITATSAVFVLMSGFALKSQAVTQSPPLKPTDSVVNLQQADDVKAQKSVKRNPERVFLPQKAMAGAGEQRYIVQFDEEPLTSYEGTITGLKATAVSKKLKSGKILQKLDADSPESVAYLNYLKQRQNSMEKTMNKELGRTLDISRKFKAALNGMSVKMTQEEAEKLSTVPGISKIELDREDFPNTDRGPTYIGAPELWNGLATGLEAKGEGIVIGILDSGINGDHPSFAAVGGDGYQHTNPLGEGNYLGECDPSNAKYNPAIPCNSKLIGRYLFIDSTPTETDSEDSDGHGSHVASTAGGNIIGAPVFDAEGNPTGLDLNISGVAPHANIIAFQVCAPSCFASDRVAAIEQAILDGQVDVINHSIGSNTPVTINPWTDAVDLAFLSARAAGITVANSIGNNGPDASTLGSSGAPWMTNSGAFTHDRDIQTKVINGFSGGDTTPPAELEGRAITAGYGPAPIVYAANYSNGDSEPAQCLVPFPEGTWTNGEIVVCDRGTIARTLKCSNVRDGGAAGCVLTNIDGGAAGVSNDAHVIPAIHLEASEGNQLKGWLSSGTDHMATISDNLEQFGSNPALGSIAGDFTSRGPHLGQDYLPVSVGAPGVDIYAALANGTEFGFLSGTSMASPHTAGASALLKQVQPQWTDAEILSALATTANTVAFKEDGITPADPFDVGGGVIRVDLAANAGLLLDESIANFEAANPALGGDPKNLNVAGLVTRACVINCSWVRTFEATADGSWSVTTSDPSISVNPETFNLLEGESQSVVITADSRGLDNGVWSHEKVIFTPVGDMPVQHLTVSFNPASGKLPDEVIILASRDADSYLVSDLEAGAIDDLQVNISGLTSPNASTLALLGDSNNSSAFDNLSDGVAFVLIDVPAEATRLVAFTTDAQSESPDVDLFIGFDLNGNGLPDANEVVCSSATATAQESCDISDLASGEWWVMVQNWQSSGAGADEIILNTAVVAGDSQNMMATGPSVVSQATPFDLRLIWDLPSSVEGTVYYGTVTLGTDSSNPDNIGVIPVTLTRGANDVTYQVSGNSAVAGDTLTFTVEVAANLSPEDRNYSIEATIPAGFSLVPESVGGAAGVTENSISWSVSQASLLNAAPGYNIVTSMEDPACAMPFANNGAYTDLEQFGILPIAAITGDTVSYSAFSGQNFNFFGESFVGGFNFTDDGFVYFNSTPGSNPWVNLPIPDVSDPNSLIAVLWRDMVIPTPNRTPGSLVGVSLASAGPNLTIIEYDNMEAWPGGGGDSIDFAVA
ncbi:MAG: S8 family serine peptidase, partial [Paraglaciecola sp.]|nr:S8 family serine peptidase [Paraglaciecola sp.]